MTLSFILFMKSRDGNFLLSTPNMGNILSPPEHTIVLIPPRISTRGLTRPIEIENPFIVGFGNLFRKEVLDDLHNFEGSVSLDVLLAPETPPILAAHLSMMGSSVSRQVQGGSLTLHLDSPIGAGIHALGRLALGSLGGLTGYSMLSYSVPWGKLSLTGVSEGRSDHWIGLRGSGKSLTLGAEIPLSSDYNKRVKAWAMSRIAESVTIGILGTPFPTGDPQIEVSASIDRRIPNSDSSYCVSAKLSNCCLPDPELTVGFTQHLVTHRKVYNPFEDKRVKFIANYVDIAVEATSGGRIAGGVSWQPNKNLLSKLHVSTDKGVVVSFAARNWWVPSVLTSASAGLDIKGTPFLGLKLQVSNWLSSVEYSKGQSVSDLPATKWLPLENVSSSVYNSSNRFI